MISQNSLTLDPLAGKRAVIDYDLNPGFFAQMTALMGRRIINARRDKFGTAC